MARKLSYKYDIEKQEKSLSQAKYPISLTVLQSGHETTLQTVAYSRVKRTALSRSCPCPVFVRIFRKVLSGVCPVSGFCQNSLSGVCLSGFCLSRFCPVSGFCLDFSGKVCPVSVCPAGQGQDRGVRIFTVAVHLTLISTGTRKTIRKNLA